MLQNGSCLALQAHDGHPESRSIHCMAWASSGKLLISADHGGNIKYFETTLNFVKGIEEHAGAPVRAVSLCPTDAKFCTCADDGTVRVFDTYRAACERLLPGAGLDF